MQSTMITPEGWKDYELIDCGDYEKLERFGKYIIARPEPQALWRKSMPQKQWEEMAHAYFKRDKTGEERGEWMTKREMPDRWKIHYSYKDMDLNMRLGLTSFKHVGIFPEQAANWNFIYDSVKELNAECESVDVLNLFAYTGGASLAACSAGAKVTHVDSVKQVVTWSRENMESSGCDGIRWIVEDARKFVNKEVKRGKQYHGVILDPPAYGRGADGEKWVLESDIYFLLEGVDKIVAKGGFVVLNLYSMGLSAMLARELMKQIFINDEIEFGELYFKDNFGKALPLGVYARMKK